MQAMYQVIPTSEYINAERCHVGKVTPCPCTDCEHRSHCAVTGQECRAWVDYNSDKKNFVDGKWRAQDRVPFDLALKAVSRRFSAGKDVVFRGFKYREGSARLLVCQAVDAMTYSAMNQIRAFVLSINDELSDRAISQALYRLKREGVVAYTNGAGWHITDK